MNPKPLSPTLRKNGFAYTLVLRDEHRAIYWQHVCENCQYYEVFKIRIRPETIFKGKPIPEREVFPTDSDFGITAWSFPSYEKALQKFNSLQR